MRLRGLKLWPVSTSIVLDEPFQRGRLLTIETGRLSWLAGTLWDDDELATVDSREKPGFLPRWDEGAGSDECRRFEGIGRALEPPADLSLGGLAVGV